MLLLKDNILATGSCDSTIKIWDIKFGVLHKTLIGHKKEVLCLSKIEYKKQWIKNLSIKNFKSPIVLLVSGGADS